MIKTKINALSKLRVRGIPLMDDYKHMERQFINFVCRLCKRYAVMRPLNIYVMPNARPKEGRRPEDEDTIAYLDFGRGLGGGLLMEYGEEEDWNYEGIRLIVGPSKRSVEEGGVKMVEVTHTPAVVEMRRGWLPAGNGMAKIEVVEMKGDWLMVEVLGEEAERWDDWQLRLNDECWDETTKVILEPVVGEVCAVRSLEDNKWHRATVSRVLSRKLVVVDLVDLERRETTTVLRLRELGASFIEQRPPIGLVRLDEVTIKDGEATWKVLRECQQSEMRVVEMDGERRVVNLYGELSGKRIVLNEYLIQRGYASLNT